MAEEGDGVNGLVEMEGGESSGVAGAEPGLLARERCEPVVGDEDEPVEVGSEAVQKRRRGQLSRGHEGEAATAGGEHGQDGAGLGPGGGACQTAEDTVIVEAEEVDTARTGQEGEETVVNARSSSAARTT